MPPCNFQIILSIVEAKEKVSGQERYSNVKKRKERIINSKLLLVFCFLG